MSSKGKRNWLKNLWIVAYWCLIVGITGYLILAITNECFSQPHGLFYEVFEDTCYILCVFCTFNVCYCINKRVEKWKYKVLIALLFSIITTATIFFLNNLWKYQSFNAMFDWENPLGYGYFLKSDLTYSIGLSEFRYPVLLVGVLAICLGGCWLVPKAKSLMSSFSFERYFCTTFSLDDYINRYMNNADYFEMLEYLEHMPGNEKTKQELIEAIFSYDLVELYDALFEKCGDLLTQEERSALESRYQKTFETKFHETEDLDCMR